MKFKICYEMDDVQNIPYRFLAETRYGRAWDCSKRKRLWDAYFNDEEKKMAGKLFRMAYRWGYVTGAPKYVEFTSEEVDMIKRLEAFCSML